MFLLRISVYRDDKGADLFESTCVLLPELVATEQAKTKPQKPGANSSIWRGQ